MQSVLSCTVLYLMGKVSKTLSMTKSLKTMLYPGMVSTLPIGTCSNEFTSPQQHTLHPLPRNLPPATFPTTIPQSVATNPNVSHSVSPYHSFLTSSPPPDTTYLHLPFTTTP